MQQMSWKISLVIVVIFYVSTFSAIRITDRGIEAPVSGETPLGASSVPYKAVLPSVAVRASENVGGKLKKFRSSYSRKPRDSKVPSGLTFGEVSARVSSSNGELKVR